jgi:hypothetical protein
MIAGLLVIIAYAIVAPGDFLVIAGVGVMLAASSALIGVLLGFLFGVPRRRTAEREGASPEAGDQSEFELNNALDQISDWLTKILVGVGLTQISDLPGAFESAAEYFAAGLSDPSNGLGVQTAETFAMTTLIAFGVGGFLFGYLWTISYMPGALTDIQKGLRDLKNQTQKDARAGDLVGRQLNPPGGQGEIRSTELEEALKAASTFARMTAFNLAREKRREGWFDQNKRDVVKLTIPVYRALIATVKDEEQKEWLSSFYGELGYALKDKKPEEWAASVEALTKAIELRGDSDWVSYEANRAVARIQTDPDYPKQKSSENIRRAILDDLRVAKRSRDMQWVFDSDPNAPEWSREVCEHTRKWMELNGLTEQDLV